MSSTPYQRDCPRCLRQFTALTDRGICPSCGLFSRISPDGIPVAVIRTCDTVELTDWPYEDVDEQFGLVLQSFADGGGPIYVADRHDGFPSITIVHEQLAYRFAELRHSVERFVPACTILQTPHDVADLCMLSNEYGKAEQLIALRWFDGQNQFDLVQCCTNDGGSVDALLNRDTFWHR